MDRKCEIILVLYCYQNIDVSHQLKGLGFNPSQVIDRKPRLQVYNTLSDCAMLYGTKLYCRHPVGYSIGD